jgi:hypothetical protein
VRKGQVIIARRRIGLGQLAESISVMRAKSLKRESCFSLAGASPMAAPAKQESGGWLELFTVDHAISAACLFTQGHRGIPYSS